MLFDINAPTVDSKDNKKIIVHQKEQTIQVIDKEIRKKIDKAKLSASMVNAILSSPADWVISKFIEPEVVIQEINFLERGNWYHKIMEHFFSRPIEERTKENLKNSVNEVTKKHYAHLLGSEEDRNWIKKAISNYAKYFLEEDKKEKIAEVFLTGKIYSGLELFVNGSIGNAKRNCLGFIDRLSEGEKGLKIHDWKTGSHISNFDPSKKISDSNSFDYWRQQTFYALLLAQKGLTIEEAALLFPCANHPQKIKIPFNNEKVIKQVIKDVELCDSILDSCIENDYTFPFRKGLWNKWATYLCGLGNARLPKIDEDKFNSFVEIK